MAKIVNTSIKKPEDYLKEPYSRILIPEEGGTYSAEILEFPGCYSFGDTAEEALSNLEEAARNWIEASLQQGQDIPAPTGHSEYSGKIALRLPSSLHRSAARMALREGVSLNQFLVNAVADRVGATSYHNQLLRRLDGHLNSFRSVIRETRAEYRLSAALTLTLRDERPSALSIQWAKEGEAASSTSQYVM